MKFYYGKGEEPLRIRKIEFVTKPALPSGKRRIRVRVWTLNGLREWGHNERPSDMDFSLSEFIRSTRMDSEEAARVVLAACAMFQSPKAGIGQLKEAVRAYEDK